MVFVFPRLPYEYNALEPFIDSLTMNLHHTKHHQTYVNQTNLFIQTVRLVSYSSRLWPGRQWLSLSIYIIITSDLDFLC